MRCVWYLQYRIYKHLRLSPTQCRPRHATDSKVPTRLSAKDGSALLWVKLVLSVGCEDAVGLLLAVG